jgi:hypothetical protein
MTDNMFYARDRADFVNYLRKREVISVKVPILIDFWVITVVFRAIFSRLRK